MKKLKVIIEPLEDTFNEIKDAVREGRKLEYVSVGSIDELNRLLTPRRKKLLDMIRTHRPKSIKELAELVGRDYKNVYKDVILLERAGFVVLTRKGKKLVPRVPYEGIEIEVKVGTL